MGDEKQQELIPGPATYRELSKPFSNLADAQAAIKSFDEGVRELRLRFKIRDVYVIMGASSLNEDGREGEFMTRFSCGDPLKGEGMTAWAFGTEQKERAANIAAILKR